MTRRGRTLWIVGVAVALLVAGFVSWYASGSPDGLEWAAEEAGFAHTAEDSAVAGSPFADYLWNGEENRLSAGAAGVVGVLLTLALAGGVTWLLRRRGTTTTGQN
ncbi:PDGLE domain-containing protein [Blastococcus sp. LR1]|uniref:PDGLE domain-containing protein n=1 Tax=Blastococcus sp. LR1 TaxID=2877000 RepID=UPI001CCB692E|nr:PDGLE domain-containing protein [Blastococcus sp. LR1]MCA0146534.1 PDGLE domain-containing protein [Blastococcus sp. LR1]